MLTTSESQMGKSGNLFLKYFYKIVVYLKKGIIFVS